MHEEWEIGKAFLLLLQVDEMMSEIRQQFGAVFDLCPTTFVLDATSAHSPALKHLRSHLSRLKARVTQVSVSTVHRRL